MITYYDKSYCKTDEIVFDINTLHVKFGFGFFETIFYNGLNICNLARHINRLESSLNDFGFKTISLNYSQVIKELLSINKLDNRNVKINIYALAVTNKQYQIMIKTEPYQYPDTQSVTLSISPHIHISYLNRYKTTNYMHFNLARQFATAYGNYDAVLCDNDNNVLECTTAALLFHDGNKFYTSKESNRLKSISVDILSERFEIEKLNINTDNIKQYTSAYIINSLIGCLPVYSINNHQFNINIDTAQNLKQLITN